MARKKQLQTNEDGWTVVAPSGNPPNDKHKNSGSDNATTMPSSQEVPRPRKLVDGLTVEKLDREFRDMQKRFGATSCARNLERMLRLREGTWTLPFENAVCVGVGSFSADWEHRYRSLWQLVLFVKVVEIVTPNQLPHIYAQDPAFTPLDTTFLSALSITTLTTTAPTHITPSTILYAPFVDWFLLLPDFLRDKDPQLYVGNEVLTDYAAFANSKGKRDVLGECNRLGKEFLEGRERRKVPGFELHGGALEGLVLYWKEEGEDGDGEVEM